MPRPVRALVPVLLLALAACTTTGEGIGASDNGAIDNKKAAQANLQLGIGYMQQGDLNTAQTKLLRARKEDPDSADVHSVLGDLYARQNKVPEADAEHRAALKLAPHDPDVRNSYAVFLCSHGREAEGVQNFREAAANRQYNTPWVAYTNAAVCLRSTHRDGEVRELLQQALALRPNYDPAVLQLADIAFAASDYGRARLIIETYLLRYPATPDLLLLAWRCAAAEGDQTAREKYGARLRHDFPESDQARSLAVSHSGTD